MTETHGALSTETPARESSPLLPSVAEVRKLRAAKTILVVEDERIVARDLQRSLMDLGYDVPKPAASADQAIMLASEHCPDLVLMDIRIKGKRDGIETASILRKRFDVPIVYLTAFADEATLERAKATEPFGYLMKPVRNSDLRSAVEIALFKHEMEKGLRERERRQLEMADRLATVGTMVAGVAHEVNNPLSFILSNVGFALEELHQRQSAPDGGVDCAWMGEVEVALHDALEGIRRVGKIAADLSTFIRGPADPGEQNDLNEILNWSIEVAGHTLRKRGSVVRRFGNVPAVDATSGRLGQVFVNLLINAAHALDPERTRTNEIVVTTRTDPEGRAVVEIRDTGGGMSPDVLKKIFEPFFTTKPVGEGTGLGLSVSHGIVASFGGTIVFESELGKGTLVRIVLPPSRAEVGGGG